MTLTSVRAPALLILAALLGAAPVDGQAPPAVGETVDRETYAMGTRLSARVEAPAAADAAESAFAAVREVESLLSSWRDDSELSAVTVSPAGEPVTVSPRLLAVLGELGPWVAATGGAFDPAVGALVDVWDLRGEGRRPSGAERTAALKRAGWSRVIVDDERGTVTRAVDGLWLDAGAFGKGLALREAAASLRERGATGVLNFGGQLVAVGVDARVGVAHPLARDEEVAGLALRDASVATTSSSERFVEVDGERLGHVLDPRTGMPVEAWGSVTVVAEDPLVADLLSTALYVMGPTAALEWSADRAEGVLVVERSGEARWNPAMERWLVTEVAAAAQDTTELERLKRQVEAITRELERMRLGGDVVTTADEGVLGFGPAASKVYQVDEGVSIGGYGEILFESFADENEAGDPVSRSDVWDAYRGILYFGYKFNDKVLVNTEIEIEHANEAYLEFAYLDYRVNERLGFRGGLLLSPMGLINELHEPPVFLGSTRPMVAQRIIPTTWRENGFGIFGDLGSFTYRAYVMNGLNGTGFSSDDGWQGFDDNGLRGGRQKGSDALAEDVGGVVRLDYVGVPGLLAGGSVYYGGSGQNVAVTLDGAEREVDGTTLIWEGHASYKASGLEVQGVLAGASVDDAAVLNAYRAARELGAASVTREQAIAQVGGDGVAERMIGGYGHIGYDVLRSLDTTHQLLPYVRYEYLNTQAEVPAGFAVNPARERTAVLLGASWKPVPQVAVKGDYQIHMNQADGGINQFAVVLSYLF